MRYILSCVPPFWFSYQCDYKREADTVPPGGALSYIHPERSRRISVVLRSFPTITACVVVAALAKRAPRLSPRLPHINPLLALFPPLASPFGVLSPASAH